MNGRLETVRKQAQDQLQVRLRPFKFIYKKRGDIQVSERRIEGGISQLEQCMIDRFNEMADVSRCTGLKHEIVPVFYPFYVRRKLHVDWMKIMSPSETCWVISHGGFRTLVVRIMEVHCSWRKINFPVVRWMHTNVMSIQERTVRLIDKANRGGRVLVPSKLGIVIIPIVFSTRESYRVLLTIGSMFLWLSSTIPNRTAP